MKYMPNLSYLLFFCAVFFSAVTAYPANWDDLDEGEKKFYGSEKEKRYPINAGVIEKEVWENHYSLMIFGLYRHTDYPKYKSLRVLPFYYNLQSKIDKRERTFIPLAMTYWSSGDNWKYSVSPLHYSEKTAGAATRSILWLTWFGSSADQTYSYSSFIPLYAYSRRKDSIDDNLFFISPVYYYNRDASNEDGGYSTISHISPFHYYENSHGDAVKEKNYTFFTPIIPLFYRSYYTRDSGTANTHTNILWLFDLKYQGDTIERLWVSPLVYYNPDDYLFIIPPLYMGSADGNDERSHRIALLLKFSTGKPERPRSIHIAPVAFHRTMEGGYRYYPPLYFRPGGWTNGRGYSFGLTHYSEWSPEKDILWFLPYYSWDEKSSGKHFTLVLPVYSSWKTGGSAGRAILPVYFHRKSAASEITVYPWSIDYSDRKYSLSIVALMFSWNTSAGILPDEVWGYSGNNPWHLDTEFSFLYNAFSISDRTSVTGGRAKTDSADDPSLAEVLQGKENLTAAAKPELKSGTHISKKREFSKDTSVSFWGWQSIFGLAAYEKGDTRRHFRILPLSWLTWDEASDDRLKVIAPIYYSYASASDELEYFVIFPLYGMQRDHESYAKAYAAVVYWDEYDAAKKRTEKSVLWPIFNWYSSSESSGFRIFPLYWRKSITEKNLITEYSLSPVMFYSRSTIDSVTKKTISRFHINPAYYYDYSSVNERQKSFFWVPIIPLYYSSLDAAPQIQASDINISGGDDNGAVEKKSAVSWLIPFYYKDSKSRLAADGGGHSSGNLAIPLIGFYYGYGRSISPESGKILNNNFTLFMLGFYRSQDQYEEETSLFYALYAREFFPKMKKHETTLLYGLIKNISTDDSRSLMIFPLWNSYSYPLKKSRSFALGLWKTEEYTWHQGEGRDSSFQLLWGLYNSGRSEYVRDNHRLTSRKFTIDDSDWMLIPFAYSKKSIHADADDKTKLIAAKSWFWFPIIPLYYYHREKEGVDELKDTIYTTAIFPLYYSSNDIDGARRNIALIADWQRGPDGSLKRLWLLPFYLYYPGKHPTVIFPIIFSGYASDDNSKTNVILGTYWYASQSRERQNLWLLFDHEKMIIGEKIFRENYDFLLYTISYTRDDYSWKFNILGGLGASAESYYEKNRWNFDFLYFIATAEKYDNSFKSSIFPLWHYKSAGGDWRIISLASMSYFSKDKYSDFDLGLLGALYYRNRDAFAKSDLRMVLLGTLWHERMRPENGYHSKGMFWGFLWDYETERETGFSKFSILKGLYKRVELEGRVKTKYFWIL